MLDVISHRGPDDRGTASFDLPDGRTATLGHRRLSILDPTPAGHQPMADATGRVHLTYNGELYNYPELKRELEARGVPLRTNCDTEVLVNLLALDGLGAVERLNGIFAFAAWDEGSGELWLARDRAGVKPLYHCRLEHGGFAFASEFKALTPLLGERRPDPQAVADYFTYLWVPGSKTVMAGIDKLEPGHVAVLRPDGSLTQTRYWSLELRPEGGRATDDWIEELSATFDGAVQAQQLSDVPLGSFLSGGLDSSAVVAAMKTDEPVTTYTIGSSAADLAHDVIVDDLPYARSLKEELHVDYHETVLTPDLAEQLPRAVWHMDEPVADPAALTTLLICQAASERLTVVMSGVGGDELFAGYPRHRAARLASLAGPLRPLAGPLERRLSIGPPGRGRALRRNAKKFLRGAALAPDERYLSYFTYFDRDGVGRLLEPLGSELAGYDPLDFPRDVFRQTAGQPYVNRMLAVDWHGFLPSLNLTYTDKMGMAASTEVRVPILDNSMVDLAARIPPELKLRGLQGKWLLKKSQERRLPHDVIWRKKAGFSAPIRSWLAGTLAPAVDRLHGDSALARSQMIDQAEARRVVDDYRSQRSDNALQIWALLTLDLWLETFVEADGSAPVSVPAGAFSG
jgi:asparagine synthase (glutamine-hydrolysing)